MGYLDCSFLLPFGLSSKVGLDAAEGVRKILSRARGSEQRVDEATLSSARQQWS